MRELFAQSDDLVGFLLRAAGKPIDAMSPEAKDGLFQECLAMMQAAPSPIVRDAYLQELRKKLGLKSISLRVASAPARGDYLASAAAADLAASKADVVALFSGDVSGGRPRDEAFAEWQLLQLLLSSPETSLSALDSLKLEWLQVAAVRNLADHLLAFVEETGKLDLKAFLERLSREDQDIVAGIRLVEGMDEAVIRKHYSEILGALELRHLLRLSAAAKTLAERMDYQKRIRELQSKNKGGQA